MSRTTIKDIANVANVSIASVHNALNNKPGLSTETRERILSFCKELGYSTNYVASSLKRGTINVAIVLPSITMSNRFFYPEVWKGINDFIESVGDFNINFIRKTYEGDFSNQNDVLKALLKEDLKLDGLITIAHYASSLEDIASLFDKKTKIVFICDQSTSINTLCSIVPDNYTVGRTAAELISHYSKPDSSVLVALGHEKIPSHSLTVKGFKDYIQKNSTRKIYDIKAYSSQNEVYQETIKTITQNSGIKSIFSCNARNTVTICRAISDLNKQDEIVIVGSDLFDESAGLLRDGVLDIILDKDPYQQANLGISTLFNKIVKNIDPIRKEVLIGPTIIIKSNLKYNYEKKIRS